MSRSFRSNSSYFSEQELGNVMRTGRLPATMTAGAKLEAGQNGRSQGGRAGVWRCRMGKGCTGMGQRKDGGRSDPPRLLERRPGGRRGQSWRQAGVLLALPRQEGQKCELQPQHSIAGGIFGGIHDVELIKKLKINILQRNTNPAVP